MEDEALRRLAHRRALMLGSIEFPPSDHLAYLRAIGIRSAAGLPATQLGDVALRDVDVAAERTDVIRVIAEATIKYGVGHEGITPAEANAMPAHLLAAELTFFGLYVDGRLNGLHGGFFWNPRLWIRRVWLLVANPYPWAVHFQIDSAIYGHLWGLGMREAMVLIHHGAPTIDGHLAAGWQLSHALGPADAPRFVWLRRGFHFDPTLHTPLAPNPAWQART